MRFTWKTVRRSNVACDWLRRLTARSAEPRGILIDDRDGRMKGACHRKVTESHHRQIGSSQLLQTGNDTARRGR
jgi:hypothetical protein